MGGRCKTVLSGQSLSCETGGRKEGGRMEGRRKELRSQAISRMPDHSGPSGRFSRLYSLVLWTFHPTSPSRKIPIILKPTCRPRYLQRFINHSLNQQNQKKSVNHYHLYKRGIVVPDFFFLPVPQDVIVIVTAAQPVATDMFPPDTGAIDGHAEQGWGW